MPLRLPSIQGQKTGPLYAILFITIIRFLIFFAVSRHIKSCVSRCESATAPGTLTSSHLSEFEAVELRRKLDTIRLCVFCRSVDRTNSSRSCSRCNASMDYITFICCRCGFSRQNPVKKHTWLHHCKFPARGASASTIPRLQWGNAVKQALRLLDFVRPPAIPSSWFFLAGRLLLPVDFSSMELIHEDGEGGFSDVYCAVAIIPIMHQDGSSSLSASMKCCVKCPHSSSLGDRHNPFEISNKTILETSVQSAASACPFILPIYAVAILAKGVATVMPICDCNLSRFFDMWTLCNEDIWAAFSQVGKAIAYIHSMDFCHMDIKLENVLWSGAHGRFFLCDFGCIARVGSRVNYGIGTKPYVAPELTDEGHTVSSDAVICPVLVRPSCDSFGLGLLLIEIFCQGQRVPIDIEASWNFRDFLAKHSAGTSVEKLAECASFVDRCMIEDNRNRCTASFLVERVRSFHPSIDAKVIVPEPTRQI